MNRQIKWVSQHLDEDPTKDMQDDEYQDSFDKLKSPNIKVVETPWGPINVDSSLNPYKHFEFWLGHTNFKIGAKEFNILNSVDGVESLTIISPYRFLVAKAEMFEWRDVRVNIEEMLCGQHSLTNDLNAIDASLREPLEEMSRNLDKKYKYWAIYMLPNGEVDWVCAETDEEYADHFSYTLSQYRLTHKKAGGIILKSDTVNES